jgi:hypothetical protein
MCDLGACSLAGIQVLAGGGCSVRCELLCCVQSVGDRCARRSVIKRQLIEGHFDPRWTGRSWHKAALTRTEQGAATDSSSPPHPATLIKLLHTNISITQSGTLSGNAWAEPATVGAHGYNPLGLQTGQRKVSADPGAGLLAVVFRHQAQGLCGEDVNNAFETQVRLQENSLVPRPGDGD